MPLTVDAIYDNGVLKPAAPLPLPEQAKVRITSEAAGDWMRQSAGILPWTGTAEELQRFAEDPDLTCRITPGRSLLLLADWSGARSSCTSAAGFSCRPCLLAPRSSREHGGHQPLAS